MFSFMDRNKYLTYAQEAIRLVDETDMNPNDVIEQIAQKNKLNPHQAQRVVEEYNINRFLNNLKEGTQHENFLLANPVIDECKEVIKIPMGEAQKKESDGNIGKTASVYDQVYIPNSAFEYGDTIDNFDSMQVHGEYIDESADLEKVAFDRQYAKEQQIGEVLIKEAGYHIDKAEREIASDLVKVANISPAVAKQVIYGLVKMGAADIAEDVTIYCKYKPQEMINASLDDDILTQTELNKFAGIKDIFSDLGKIVRIKESVKNGNKKAAKTIIEAAKSNPGKALQAILSVIRFGKNITGDENDVATEIAAFGSK